MVDAQQLRATQASVDSADPTGVWAGAPAIAASTVDMKNTSGRMVEVTIIGGTYTVVKKNGAVINNLTSAIVGATHPYRIELRPNATISITYSVAPTLQWLYK